MKSGILRAISIHAVTVLVAFTIALALSFAFYIYVHRQAFFAESAFTGSLSRMKALYALGVDVNAPGCEYRSCFNAIWGAAYGGYDDEIQFLVDRGADVDAHGRLRTTALMVAAYKGHKSTVQLLLSKGADVNANIAGDTALSLARDKGHPEIVELLQQASAIDTP